MLFADVIVMFYQPTTKVLRTSCPRVRLVCDLTSEGAQKAGSPSALHRLQEVVASGLRAIAIGKAGKANMTKCSFLKGFQH